MKSPRKGRPPGIAGQLCGFCPRMPAQDGGPAPSPRCALRRFDKGATVTPSGATTRQVGFVMQGVLRLARNLSDGHQQLVGLLLPGDHFGELFVDRAPYDVECASDALLCTRDRLEFEAMLARNPSKEHELLSSSVSELRAAREWMSVLGLPTIRERVAAFLLLLIAREGNLPPSDGAPIRVRVPVSRRDMANFIYTRPETISRVIHGLVRDGVLEIETAQQFIVPAHAALVTAAGGELFTLAPSTRTEQHARVTLPGAGEFLNYQK